jgi:hypothetical protein
MTKVVIGSSESEVIRFILAGIIVKHAVIWRTVAGRIAGECERNSVLISYSAKCCESEQLSQEVAVDRLYDRLRSPPYPGPLKTTCKDTNVYVLNVVQRSVIYGGYCRFSVLIHSMMLSVQI